MGLEFVQRSLYFPSFMVQRSQFFGRTYFVIKDCCEQSVDWFRTLNPLQSVLYDSNDNSIFFVTLVFLRSIDSAKVRSIRKSLFAWQADVCLNSPEQIGTCATGLHPQLKSVEVPVRKAQHPLAQRMQHLLGKRDLPGLIAPNSSAEQNVGSVFNQRHEPQLWEGTAAATGRRSSESFLVTLFVGRVQRASVNTDQAPVLVPSAFRRFHGDRLHNLVMKLPNRLPSQARPSLRYSRLASHLDNGFRPQKPLDSFEKATQNLAARRLHVQSQSDDVVNNHMRRQLSLANTCLAGLFESSFNSIYRKRFSNYAQANVISNPGATRKFSNSSCHTRSSCRSFRQDTTQFTLSEQYCT